MASTLEVRDDLFGQYWVTSIRQTSTWPATGRPVPTLCGKGGWNVAFQWLGVQTSATQTSVVSPAELPSLSTGRTPLGRRLWQLRQQAIAAGMKLLSEDEVLREVYSRRGDLDNGNANLR